MSAIKLKFNLLSTDSTKPLRFRCRIDGQESCSIVPGDMTTVECLLNDDSSEHVLEFVLENKQPTDTVINDNGEIIKDAVVKISNIEFDDIAIGHNIINLFEYTHDFNGTKELTTEKFFGTMGCNGTAKLTFTTPIYLWLLENM